ncbi:MAG TPA: DegV family protein [Candidatus Acetatifactor stercoripullorum]|uniref:DegV family protein n=1 Tax=Candidatus Acetatifactor stercoripullorum TaxID=2838414 RepID=A0A9D1R7V4_9FIRM|nr:DegV family protein [uncultured Acetatifactor sp.]HIW82133.1 DegV family protein [Candidatus Acetatifactor stercoripullorum]
MSEAYHIVSDGSCDLPPALVREIGVTVVPFYVSFGDENYQKEIEEIGIREFYQKMVDNPKIYPKSSMPSVQDYVEVFEPLVREGKPVICICITTKFSGSMQSALNARQMLLEEYPEAEITVMDATVNTVLQGLLVLEAVRLRDRGTSCQDTIKRLEEIKGTGRIFFTIGGMEYLQHGGRIGKVAGVAGSVLGIRPVITLKQGEIFPSAIGRSRRKTMDKTIELLLAYLDELKADIRDYTIAVGYGYDEKEAQEYRDRLLDTLQKKCYAISQVPIYQIGATIGVHTGPYPIGIGILRKAF